MDNPNSTNNSPTGLPPSDLSKDGNRKILIVEDDQFLREFYQELLETEGFKVETASDGGQASLKMNDGGYDLVLLDIMLPVKDGLQLLKEVKANPPKSPNKAIIMLTNLGQDTIIKECFTLGATGYLIKSALNPDQVLNEIHNYLRSAS